MTYQTNETNGHIHTVSNPASGMTDPGPDGHSHSLNIPSCQSCRKARRLVVGSAENIFNKALYPTGVFRGHRHYYSSDVLKELKETKDGQ